MLTLIGYDPASSSPIKSFAVDEPHKQKSLYSVKLSDTVKKGKPWQSNSGS